MTDDQVMTALYIIHWRSSITGKTGHGTQPLMLEDVQAIVARLNRKYKYIFHWYETAPRSAVEIRRHPQGRGLGQPVGDCCAVRRPGNLASSSDVYRRKLEVS